MSDFYQTLGLNPESNEQEIKRAYRQLAMQYHPDKNKAVDANQRFVAIQEAYDFLMDPNLRFQYDHRLKNGFATYTSSANNFTETYQNQSFTPKDRKYHRGKKPPERDLEQTFNNFETKYFSDFSLDFYAIGRVVLLGIPGVIISFYFSAPYFYEDSFMDKGDLFITCPFITFHLFVLIDFFLPNTKHYALLTKVVNHPFSSWQELFLKTTSGSVTELNYHNIKNVDWYKDRMYVCKSPVDFSIVQQFQIRKSFLFRMKFNVYGIVDNELKNLNLNDYKKVILCVFTVLQAFLLFLILSENFIEPLFFILLLALQIYHINYFFASNKLSFRRSFHDILRWLE